MPGKRGAITRAKGGGQKSVYLSDRFGVWEEDGQLHMTFLQAQEFHTSIKPQDGLLYDVLMMLYRYGIRK